MSKIDEAIERLNNGSFGVCEECGEVIDIERLEIRPVTTYCIRCKENLEAKENNS
jgi:DnaK suppressor protein